MSRLRHHTSLACNLLRSLVMRLKVDSTVVFIGSTFADLSTTRSKVAAEVKRAGHHPVVAEHGNLSYDPDIPPDQSCYAKAAKSHAFLLIVGRNYGSPASNASRRGVDDFRSITRREYQTARDVGVPVYTFIDANLKAEYQSFKSGKKCGHKSVDSVQVFKLIDEIEKQKTNKFIHWFDRDDDIAPVFLGQLSGLLRRNLENAKSRKHKVPINCYKLFYFRTDRNSARGEALDLEVLSDKTGIAKSFLQKIESVRPNTEPVSIHNFHQCELSDIEKLEAVLNCRGQLRADQSDDHLTEYLLNYRTRASSGRLKKNINQLELDFDTQALVFDFDGTLTTERGLGTVWERLWEAVGLSKQECSGQHERFRRSEITHKEWCELTTEKFRQAGLTRSKVDEVAQSICLVPGVDKTLRLAKAKNLHVSILSGSIEQVIRKVLNGSANLIDDVKANKIEYDHDGLISRIQGTPYDFRHKPDYIKTVIRDRKLDPLQVLFVGNSANDAWASRSGARTLCVNPVETDPGNFRNWTSCIRYMSDLTEVLPVAGIRSEL